ncbi:cytochrome-c peroxidase [Ekhidna sp.]
MKNLTCLILVVLLGVGCKSESSKSESNLIQLANDNFESISKSSLDKNNPKVVLGKALFFEKRLSIDNSISCNSCHDIKKFGVDNLDFSNGARGALTKRNSPTILNTHLQSSQFWDGRAQTLQEQIRMPMLTDVEMSMPSEEFIVKKVSKIEFYAKSFGEVYPNQDVSMENISEAIANYIESLTTPSKFDDFLAGNAVLSSSETRGMKVFIDKGCAECHSGKLLGDGFEEFGVFDSYWKYTKSQKIDSGRYSVTKNEDDLFVFKVPSLRNVTETYPYFHDGSIKTLKEAVKIMAQVQLDEQISERETDDIISFLNSLKQSQSTGSASSTQ